MATRVGGQSETSWTGPRLLHGGLRAAFRGVRYQFLSDGDLVRRVELRDNVAFRTLLSRYRRQVRDLSLSPMADDDHGEVDLRDSLVSAFRGIDAFAARCTPGTWLYLHGLRSAFGRLNAAVRARAAEHPPTRW